MPPLKQFRTGWFLESVFRQRLLCLSFAQETVLQEYARKALLIATVMVIGLTLIAPLTPLGTIFELIPMPASFLLVLIIILMLYILCSRTGEKAVL